MKYLKIAMALMAGFASVSCLKSGLEDLETYTGNDIESIPGIYFRYYSNDIHPASGEQVIKQATLSVSNTVIDPDAGTVFCNVSIPSGFPADQRNNVSLEYKPGDKKSIIVTLRISTAATIKPLDGAPELGTPGDWSKPNRYLVTAADGSTKEWTVTLSNNMTYKMTDEVLYDQYGWAFWNENAQQWRIGYRYHEVGFVYFTFKSKTGGMDTPPYGTVTTDEVLSAMWLGNDMTVTNCNITLTPATPNWPYPWNGFDACEYKITGSLTGKPNNFETVTFEFTGDGSTMNGEFPAFIASRPEV